MTIEEKAYDEALEQAKKELAACGSMDCDAARLIFRLFPQLRESEDERIRARLIEYFQGFLEGYEDCYKDGGCVKWEGLDVKSILAWLEKQKETADSFTDGIIEVRSFQRGMEEGRKLETQKECVADSSKTSANEDESIRKFLVDYFTSYKIGNVATKLNGVRIEDILNYLEKQKDLDKIIVVSPEVLDNAISDAYENGKKEGEKQKEQKHPDGCFTCDEYKKGYEEGRRNGFTAGYNKAMKEVEQKEQKPALKQTLDAYKISDERATAKMEGRIEGRQDVINNPEEYGLQKPAEWSEEDERILYNVIAYVGYAAGERGVKDDDFKEANEWLRNLRSHSSWKPSEEQMNCLCAAVDAAIRKHNESVSGYKPARVLKSLYEQLQRLM